MKVNNNDNHVRVELFDGELDDPIQFIAENRDNLTLEEALAMHEKYEKRVLDD